MLLTVNDDTKNALDKHVIYQLFALYIYIYIHILVANTELCLLKLLFSFYIVPKYFIVLFWE